MGPLPHGGGSLVEASGGSNTPRPVRLPRLALPGGRAGAMPRRSPPNPQIRTGPGPRACVTPSGPAMERLVVRGATQHNLKSVSCDLPRNRLVVITGPSGSGKSSLAFDTIYAEGQRRYVESLSAYARQFLDQLPKPRVESIEGLSPAIAIEQKGLGKSPRSTVGTVTEIADYLRLLYARIGVPHCPKSGKVLRAYTVQEIVDEILGRGEGARLSLLSPIARARKSDLSAELEHLRR